LGFYNKQIKGKMSEVYIIKALLVTTIYKVLLARMENCMIFINIKFCNSFMKKLKNVDF